MIPDVQEHKLRLSLNKGYGYDVHQISNCFIADCHFTGSNFAGDGHGESWDGDSETRHSCMNAHTHHIATSVTDIVYCAYQGGGDERRQLCITRDDLAEALKDIKPSVSQEERQRFTEM